MQQVFAVLFFVSVGMLFDPLTLVRMPVEIAALLLTIVIGTGLTTILILLALRASPDTAALFDASTSLRDFARERVRPGARRRADCDRAQSPDVSAGALARAGPAGLFLPVCANDEVGSPCAAVPSCPTTRS